MNNKRGFTLFELLISISIIGIMTALAIVSFSSAQKKARNSRRIQDMNAISKAAELYYGANNSTYPTTFAVGISWPNVLEAIPMDPKGVGYTTPTTLTTTDYCICAYMEGQNGNSTTQNCTFTAAGVKQWYCVKNQQ